MSTELSTEAPEPRAAVGYLIAVGATLTAVLLRIIFRGPLGEVAPFMPFFGAVAVAARYGGVRSGLLATVLSALTCVMFFMLSETSPERTRFPEVVSVVLFIVLGIVISMLYEALHVAQRRLVQESQQRRRSEELLIASRRRLSIATEAAGLGIFEWDAVADLAVWENKRIYDIHGAPETDTPLTREKFLASVIHPEDRGVFEAALQEALKNQGHIHAAYRIRRADTGECRWLEINGQIQFAADGVTPLRVLGVIGDITDRKQQEAARRHSEQQLRLVADNAPVLIVHCDTDARFKFVNKTYANRFGLQPSDIIGKRVPEIVGTEAFATFERYMKEVVSGNPVEFEIEIPYEALGKHFMHVAYTPERDESGAVVGLVGAIIDITERRRVEDALRESEERFRLAADAVNGIIYEFDLATDHVARTRGVLEVLGYHPEEAPPTGRWWREQIHPDDRHAYEEAVQQAIALCHPLINRYRVRHRDGRWLHMEDRAMVRADAAGRAVKIIGCTVDVTDAHCAQVTLEEQAKELKDADRRKDEFLATLAHELRNPMAPLRNGLQVIRLAGAEGPIEQARVMMDRQLTHLVRLVDDLLDVSRITRGKLDLRHEPVDLRTVLEHAVETSRPIIDQAGHTLTLDLPAAGVIVDGDSTRLSQAIANLLNNSAKYTHRGGTIRLSTAVDDRNVRIVISDDGIGIPPHMLGKIFDLFTQVDRRLEKTTGGLGIGLSLVKGIVEMHGGKIECTSEGEGCGSTFVVVLPQSRETVAEAITLPVEVTIPSARNAALSR